MPDFTQMLPDGPAWVIALAVAFYLGARAVLALKMPPSSGGSGSGNDGTMLGRIVTLAEATTRLQESHTTELRQLREVVAKADGTHLRVADVLDRLMLQLTGMSGNLAPAIDRAADTNVRTRDIQERVTEIHEQMPGLPGKVAEEMVATLPQDRRGRK